MKTSLKVSKKLPIYFSWLFVFAVPLLFFPYILKINYQCISSIHILIEFWGGLLACTTGILLLIHFFATGKSFFLVLSLGFTLQGIQDWIHTFISFYALTFDNTEYFSPLSGIIGRFFLIAALFYALFVKNNEIVLHQRTKKAFIFYLWGFFILVLFSLFFQEFSHFFLSSYLPNRFLDFLAGILFFVLLLFFIRTYLRSKEKKIFLQSMILSLLLSIDSQIYIVQSRSILDSLYITAHLLKLLAYFFPMIGLSLETLEMYKKEEKEKKALHLAAKIEQQLTEMHLERVKASSEKKSLAIKSNFISVVSHELRTPLTAIKEGLSLVLEEITGSLKTKQKEILKTVQQNVERLARLINEVLDFQKLDARKMNYHMLPNHINQAVHSVIDIQSPLLRQKNLALVLQLDKNLPLCIFDMDRIIQVISNLLSNAIEYTNEGSITITTQEKDSSILVSITDTGIGIREKDVKLLFHSFTQLSQGKDRKTGGTGLGLSISKKIISQHHGTMSVESTFGKGSTFSFSLPLTKTKEKS